MQMHSLLLRRKARNGHLRRQYRGKRIYWKAFAYAEGRSGVIFAVRSVFSENVAKSAEILKARPLSAPQIAAYFEGYRCCSSIFQQIE
jgi:hypothetical protein